MGNRAVITTELPSTETSIEESSQIGVYLHWNGGRDSVEGFLTYCELKGFRTPETDTYGMARLVQVIANYFDSGLSVGVGQCKYLDCDNYDNGVYFIKDWKIIGRLYLPGEEQAEYDLLEMVCSIDEKQPVAEQLGREAITLALSKT